MVQKTILDKEPFSNPTIENWSFSFKSAIVLLMAAAGALNFSSAETIYLMVNSLMVSFAAGSIKLNKMMLKRTEIAIPINAEIK